MKNRSLFFLATTVLIANSFSSAGAFTSESEDEAYDLSASANATGFNIDGAKPPTIDTPAPTPSKGAESGSEVSGGVGVVWRPASDAVWGCSGTREDQFEASGCHFVSLACSAVGFASGEKRSFVIGSEVDARTGNRTGKSRGACVGPGKKSGGAAGGEVVPEVVVSESDLRSLGIEPLRAHLGPEGDWIPVNADVIVYAERKVQTLKTRMLGQDVVVRATPVRYEWALGDGTRVSTHFAGRAYPARDIAMRFQYQGWYEMSLTTYFAGEYSVNGGEFQPIEGEVGVPSQKKWIYADSRESRLVNGPVEKAHTTIPPRSKATLGPVNPDAKHTRLHAPGRKKHA